MSGPDPEITRAGDVLHARQSAGLAYEPRKTTPPAAGGWLNLWLFAKKLSPRTCSLAAIWMSGPSSSLASMERAKAKLLTSDPSVMNEVTRIRSKLRPGEDERRAIDLVWITGDFLPLLQQEIDRRTRKRRFLANVLMARLSIQVRGALSQGGYEIIAGDPGTPKITLTESDLVGLEVDLANSALSGDGMIYTTVRVRAIEKSKSSDDAAPAVPAPPLIVATGTAGRPTSMHLIRPEHERRIAAGDAHPSVTEEAKLLAEWIKQTHPTAPPPKPITIQNQISARHRSYSATHKMK